MRYCFTLQCATGVYFYFFDFEFYEEFSKFDKKFPEFDDAKANKFISSGPQYYFTPAFGVCMYCTLVMICFYRWVR